MSSQLENNNTTIQSILEQINALPGVSVTSVNGKTGKIVLTVNDIEGAALAIHTHAASDIIEGTFAGAVAANSSNQTPGAALLRNSTLVTVDTNPSNNGEICWIYE